MYYGNYGDMYGQVFALPISKERNILEFRKCPFVSLLKNHLHWNETADGLHFTETGLLLSLSEFVYGNSEQIIWVCMETYEMLLNSGISVSLNSSHSYSIIFILTSFILCEI